MKMPNIQRFFFAVNQFLFPVVHPIVEPTGKQDVAVLPDEGEVLDPEAEVRRVIRMALEDAGVFSPQDIEFAMNDMTIEILEVDLGVGDGGVLESASVWASAAYPFGLRGQHRRGIYPTQTDKRGQGYFLLLND